MKKILTVAMFAISLLGFISAEAQLRKIPAEVTDAFAQKYPDASAVEWKDKLTSFAASFKSGGIAYVASFDKDGEWENTEEKLTEAEIPDEVNDGLDKSKYADWKIAEVTKIHLPNDEVQYRLEVAQGDIKKRNLTFNNEGRLLKDKLTI